MFPWNQRQRIKSNSTKSNEAFIAVGDLMWEGDDEEQDTLLIMCPLK